ncbi:hypothetical protein EDB86DRAFT_2337240 [Lactarius hatsudake]|nr:hypothetical protein EDB86DRAFT_2337240 [Lactarius hatsudake]
MRFVMTGRNRLTSSRPEKLAVEERAVEQAEALRRLTEENGVLSARVRTLQLAEDAAAAQEELRTVSTVSEREQPHRLALLEKINLVQTENGSLRQQLRARWGSYSDSGRVGEGTWRHVRIPFLFFYFFGKPGTLPCRAFACLASPHLSSYLMYFIFGFFFTWTN